MVTALPQILRCNETSFSLDSSAEFAFLLPSGVLLLAAKDRPDDSDSSDCDSYRLEQCLGRYLLLLVGR